MVADEVVVTLEARIADYQRKLAAADKSFTTATSNMANQAKRTGSIANSAFSSIGIASALSVGGVIALGAAFINVADKAKLLDAQLKLATAGFGSFAIAQKDVRDIAMQTRAPLQETGRLYSTLIRSANELGITQKEAARATLSISQAFRISGSDAVSAAQGTRQLIQAIQSGTLRGDEFNTMMEGAPRLARLMADSLGVPVTSLRALAEQGKITSDQILEALTGEKFTKALDEEFKRLPVTFQDAMTLVHNAAQITFSAFDRGGQFSAMLANFVTEGASDFGALEKRAEIAGANLAATFGALDNIFDPMGENAFSVMRMIENEIRGMQNLIGNFLDTIDNIRNRVRPAVDYASAIITRNPAMMAYAGGGGSRPQSNLGGQFRMDIRKGVNESLLRGIMQTPLSADAQLAYGGDPRGDLAMRPAKATKAKKKGGKSEAEKVAEAAAREQARAFSAEQRLVQLTEDLAAARAAQLVAAEAIYQFQLQQIENDRLQANARVEQDVITKTMTRAEADRAIILNDQIAAEKAKLAGLEEEERQRAASSEIAQAQKANEVEVLEQQAKTIRNREEQLDAQLIILDAQYELQALALEEVIASRTSTQAQKDIAQAKLDMLSDLKRAEKRDVKKEYASPGEQYLDELETKAANVQDEIEQIAVDKVKELAGAFGEATANALGLTGILGDLVSKLAEMAFQYAIILPLMRQVFGGGGGGLFGGLFGGIGGGTGAGDWGSLSSSGIYGDLSAYGMAGGGDFSAGQRRIVGERGPEIVEFPAAGRVIPNHALNTLGGGEGGVVKMMVASSPFFNVEVQKVAGAVSVEVVRRAAPEIANISSAKTRMQMGRPHM